MKSDLVKKLLRALVTALGIGLGSVLAFVIVQLNAMAGNPAMSVGALLALGLLALAVRELSGADALCDSPQEVADCCRRLIDAH